MESRKLLLCCTFTFSALLEFFVRYFDLWHLLGYNMDNVMHVFWGLNVFLILLVFLRWEPQDAFLAVLAWQLIWEAGEMIGDVLIQDVGYQIDHFFFDGVKDTVMDMLGGLLGWGLLAIKTFSEGLEDLKESPLRVWFRSLAIWTLPLIVIGGAWSLWRAESMDAFAVLWIIVLLPLSFAYAWKQKRNRSRTRGARRSQSSIRGGSRGR